MIDLRRNFLKQVSIIINFLGSINPCKVEIFVLTNNRLFISMGKRFGRALAAAKHLSNCRCAPIKALVQPDPLALFGSRLTSTGEP